MDSPHLDSPSLLRSLMTNVPGAIYRCAWDKDWTMQFVGDEIERITGYPASDFIDNECRTFASVIHPDDRAGVEQQVGSSVKLGVPFSLEYRIVRADGGVRWVMERGLRALDQDGTTWLDGVIFDITERREFERVAREREAEAARVSELEASRARIIAASDRARRQLERDLHDGAQQRFVTATMTVGMAEHKLNGHDPELALLLAEVRAELDAGLKELRELARGIHPALLADRGLDAALEVLATRASLEVVIEGELGERLDPSVELALYFTAAEALTNAAKHAGCEEVVIRVETAAGEVRLQVIDDGCGGADGVGGTGLRGLADRLGALDGTLDVVSPHGMGTMLTATVPTA